MLRAGQPAVGEEDLRHRKEDGLPPMHRPARCSFGLQHHVEPEHSAQAEPCHVEGASGHLSPVTEGSLITPWL